LDFFLGTVPKLQVFNVEISEIIRILILERENFKNVLNLLMANKEKLKVVPDCFTSLATNIKYFKNIFNDLQGFSFVETYSKIIVQVRILDPRDYHVRDSFFFVASYFQNNFFSNRDPNRIAMTIKVHSSFTAE
jgi:hypothetical protein